MESGCLVLLAAYLFIEWAGLTLAGGNDGQRAGSRRQWSRIGTSITKRPGGVITDSAGRAAEVPVVVIEAPCTVGAGWVLQQGRRAVGRRGATVDVVLLGTRGAGRAASAKRSLSAATVDFFGETAPVTADGEPRGIWEGHGVLRVAHAIGRWFNERSK